MTHETASDDQVLKTLRYAPSPKTKLMYKLGTALVYLGALFAVVTFGASVLHVVEIYNIGGDAGAYVSDDWILQLANITLAFTLVATLPPLFRRLMIETEVLITTEGMFGQHGIVELAIPWKSIGDVDRVDLSVMSGVGMNLKEGVKPKNVLKMRNQSTGLTALVTRVLAIVLENILPKLLSKLTFFLSPSVENSTFLQHKLTGYALLLDKISFDLSDTEVDEVVEMIKQNTASNVS